MAGILDFGYNVRGLRFGFVKLVVKHWLANLCLLQ